MHVLYIKLRQVGAASYRFLSMLMNDDTDTYDGNDGDGDAC